MADASSKVPTSMEQILRRRVTPHHHCAHHHHHHCTLHPRHPDEFPRQFKAEQSDLTGATLRGANAKRSVWNRSMLRNAGTPGLRVEVARHVPRSPMLAMHMASLTRVAFTRVHRREAATPHSIESTHSARRLHGRRSVRGEYVRGRSRRRGLRRSADEKSDHNGLQHVRRELCVCAAPRS